MQDHAARAVIALSLVLLLWPLSAPAQQIILENGAAFHMSNGGVWDLQGTTMNFGDTGATAHLKERTAGRITGGRLTATRALDRPSSANAAGLGAEISASVDLGEVTVRRGHDRFALRGNRTSIKRFYEISPSGTNRGLRATLTFHYADAELGDLPESALELFKSNVGRSNWRPKGADGRDTIANTVTLSRVRSFSRWTLGLSKGAGPPTDPPEGGPPASTSTRPMKKMSLAASVVEDGSTGSQVVLRWQEASKMSGRFEVQHKGPASGDAWSTIGDVKSEATGDSETEARFYLFRSEDLAVGTHQFRVRQVGQNGANLTTDPVRVQVEMKKALRLTPPAPNPVRSEAMVRFGTKDAQRVEVALYDVLGRQVRTLFEGRPPPGEMQTARLVARGLPAGTYFVRLTAGGKTQVRRLTVAR